MWRSNYGQKYSKQTIHNGESSSLSQPIDSCAPMEEKAGGRGRKLAEGQQI
jgi:hypothetical protein